MSAEIKMPWRMFCHRYCMLNEFVRDRDRDRCWADMHPELAPKTWRAKAKTCPVLAKYGMKEASK